MSDIKLGSLFDGSGGFPLAGAIFGIRPVWASEIEPYPIRVTTARFPEMKHLGDITKINGAEIEAVDIITFGSPCQDLSVAGKRLGLEDGERSNLFYQAVRIIKEMREATNGEYPRYAVWENVPGAFSSNGGKDFQAVLQTLCQVKDPNAVVPEPANGKWQHAGAIVADGYSVAWRLYDAQFWGVPQRRKRIYLIADFTTDRAPEILFEQESLRGDIETGTTEREDSATDAQGSVGRSDCVVGIDGYNTQATGDKSITIRAGKSDQDHVGCVCIPNKDNVKCLNQWDVQSKHQHDISGAFSTLYAGAGGKLSGVCYSIDGYNASQSDKASTLGVNCGMSSGRNSVCLCLNDQGGSVMNVSDKPGALRAQMKHHEPIACYSVENHPHDSRVQIDEHGKVQTLSSRMGTGGNNTPLVLCVGNGQNNQAVGDKAGTLNCMHDQQAVLCVSTQQGGATIMDDKCPTLTAAAGMSGNNQPYICQDGESKRKYIIRRLTPLECCRLQGFPDWWTDGVDGSDSAQYKMWGNGIALPCAVDVIGRLHKQLTKGGDING